MSGAAENSSDGQLALLDAVVFFVIAIAISAFSWCQTDLRGEMSVNMTRTQAPRTTEMLSAFLKASISTSVVLELPERIVVRADVLVSECVAFEAFRTLDGCPDMVFAPLNRILESVLRALSGTSWEYYFEVWHVSDRAVSVVFALPCVHPSVATSYSASSLLPSDRTDLLVVLVLTPAASPGLRHIAGGHLDFRPGICQTSSDFDPREHYHESQCDDCGIEVVPVVLGDVHHYQRRRNHIEDIERIRHPCVRNLDGRRGPEAHDAAVPDGVPALDPQIFAARAVEILHACPECGEDIYPDRVL